MINKTELKDVVLRFQSKTDISIKDIFGEAPSKEQEKMWVKFLKMVKKEQNKSQILLSMR